MNSLLVATTFLAQATEPVGVPPWVPIVIGVIILLLFWWGLNRNSIPRGVAVHEDAHAEDEHEAAETLQASRTSEVNLPETAVIPDDLKTIEGIGPKIEGILHDAGIRTFAELAAASVSQLERIVREDAGIRVAFPDTWPEQAQLAANEKWDELAQLQDDLKGGRRA